MPKLIKSKKKIVHDKGYTSNKYIEHWVEDGYTDISYILDGSKILKETRTGNQSVTIYYLYDSSGSVIVFSFFGNTYYFGKNIQGDVIYVYKSNGTIHVKYH